MTAIHRFVEQARRGDHPRVIARMPSGWAVLGPSQLLPGYSLLCPDPVVGSLNELDEQARAAFLLDMARLGDAVLKVCRPLRLNYAMLGNVEPALHAHIIPATPPNPWKCRPNPSGTTRPKSGTRRPTPSTPRSTTACCVSCTQRSAADRPASAAPTNSSIS